MGKKKQSQCKKVLKPWTEEGAEQFKDPEAVDNYNTTLFSGCNRVFYI